MNNRTIGVLAIDSQPLVRVGLEVALRADPGIHLVGLCETGEQGIAACTDPEVAVVLLDVLLSDKHGVDVCRTIKRLRPDVEVLVLTTTDDSRIVFDAISAGASGYVLKDITVDNLRRAIRAVVRGETMLHPGIARRVLGRLSAVAANGHGAARNGEGLTDRETSILALVAKGATNKEIAIKLFMSESTVKSRLRIIFNKINVQDRTQAAAYAVRGGYAS